MLVVAVEEAVEDLAQGADVVQVVQDDHQGALHPRHAAALLSQTRQVLTQFLQREREINIMLPLNIIINMNLLGAVFSFTKAQ